jgi:biopolymer transport protein ExbB/TolQ
MNSTISLFAISFSFLSLLISLVAIVIVLAQKWSTHKIEWKPLQIHDPLEESYKEIKATEDEDSKILEEALNLQRKGNKFKEQDPLDEVFKTNNF